jgi:predicted O-methyltransferase YrrM
MRFLTVLVLIFLLMLFLLGIPALSAETSSCFKIPRVQGIVVDGTAEDWGNHGFRVAYLTDPKGRILPADDFDAKFRIGWNDQGLLVLASIRDDVPVEHEDLSRLWRTDCLEIFIGENVGSENRCQLVVASGADARYGKVRFKLYDWRPEGQKMPELKAQTASRVCDDGYVIEALLPWANLGLDPKPGAELAFQFVANDDDGDSDTSGCPLRVAWFPGMSPTNPGYMYRLRLSDIASEPILYRVSREITLGRCAISLSGANEILGKTVVLRRPDGVITQGRLEQVNGRAGVQFDLEPAEDEWPQVDVLLDGKTIASFDKTTLLDVVLEKYVQALGGHDVLERMSTRVCRGKFVHDLPWNKPPKVVEPFEAYAKTPDKWCLVLETAKGTEQEGFDGEVGWRQNSDRIERYDSLGKSWLAFLLNPQGPLHIENYFPGMILKGKKMLKGRDVYVVEPGVPGKEDELLYFDVETGFLTQIGNFRELLDYREVDDVKVPFSILISRKGGSNTFVFERIKHNVVLDQKKFSIPDPGEVFADAFEGIENPVVAPLLRDFPPGHEDMNVPYRDGRFLYDLIIEKGYKRGLEIGTFTGYSALWFGLAFQKTGGQIFTIEIDPVSGKTAQEMIRRAGLDAVVDARINDAFEEIPKIEGMFDFVFIDAWKPDYIKFLRMLKDRILPGGAVVAHNVTNYARDMREYLDAIKTDPGLETSFCEISAEGMSISIKK